MTIDDIKKGSTNGLPEGYLNIVNHFKKEITIYGIQYVNEDDEVQKSRTAFFKINGKWIFIPRLIMAFN